MAPLDLMNAFANVAKLPVTKSLAREGYIGEKAKRPGETNVADFCKQCRRIDWDVIFHRNERLTVKRSLPGMLQRAKFNDTRIGCPLCSMLHGTLLRSVSDDPTFPFARPQKTGKQLAGPRTVKMCEGCASREDTVAMMLFRINSSAGLGVAMPCEVNEDGTTGLSFHYGKMHFSSRWRDARLSWHEDVRDFEHKEKIPLSISTLGKGIREVMKEWIHHCDTNHKACRLPPTEPVLPRRVIDVGTLEQPSCHVLQSRGETGRWAALSYCWGPTQQLGPRLTSESLSEMLEAIPFDLLATSIQDAIRLTRELGLRYLWVDCLCILQESAADWEEQSLAMATVYGQAYIVLAATGADTANGSLYLDRLEANVAPVHIHCRSVDGVRDEMWLHSSRIAFRKSLDQSPLYRRGWCLQEVQLPVRVLCFNKGEVLWQCRTGVTRELTPIQLVATRDPFVPKRLFCGAQSSVVNIFTTWTDLVQQFTLRRLTHSSDALPAMSGIAAEIVNFLDNRPRRRCATQAEVEQICGPNFFAKGPLSNGMPDGEANANWIFEQMERAREDALPGQNMWPLKSDPWLIGGMMGYGAPCCNEKHKITPERAAAVGRILKMHRVPQVTESVMRTLDEDDEDLLERLHANTEYKMAFRRSLDATHKLLHEGIDESADWDELASDHATEHQQDDSMSRSDQHFQNKDEENTEQATITPLPTLGETNSSEVSRGQTDAVLDEHPPDGMAVSLYIYPDDCLYPPLVEWPVATRDTCYLAGIWRADIWFGLRWAAAVPGIRPAEYHGPSWAWSSLPNSPIFYLSSSSHSSYMRNELSGQRDVPDQYLLDSRTRVDGSNPYGRPSSGRIVITTGLYDMPMYADESGEWLSKTNEGLASREGVFMDERYPLSPFCCYLVLDSLTRLIIESVSSDLQSNTYRRVGIWSYDMRDEPRDVVDTEHPLQIITLI